MTSDVARPVIHVVAGALWRDGKVLIAQRPPGKHLAGGWEFPGGKLERDEAPRAGLVRELAEELGIDVQACQPVMQCTHHYPDRSVLLDLWLVTAFAGTPQCLDAQALRWVRPADLPHANMLPADLPLIDGLIEHLRSTT